MIVALWLWCLLNSCSFQHFKRFHTSFPFFFKTKYALQQGPNSRSKFDFKLHHTTSKSLGIWCGEAGERNPTLTLKNDAHALEAKQRPVLNRGAFNYHYPRSKEKNSLGTLKFFLVNFTGGCKPHFIALVFLQQYKFTFWVSFPLIVDIRFDSFLNAYQSSQNVIVQELVGLLRRTVEEKSVALKLLFWLEFFYSVAFFSRQREKNVVGDFWIKNLKLHSLWNRNEQLEKGRSFSLIYLI